MYISVSYIVYPYRTAVIDEIVAVKMQQFVLLIVSSYCCLFLLVCDCLLQFCCSPSTCLDCLFVRRLHDFDLKYIHTVKKKPYVFRSLSIDFLIAHCSFTFRRSGCDVLETNLPTIRLS